MRHWITIIHTFNITWINIIWVDTTIWPLENLFINGKCLNQADEVSPQPPEQDFGIAATDCELIIRSKLQYMTRDRPA